MRPLARASRLVGTVATLAAATVLAWVAEAIAKAFDGDTPGLASAPPDTRPPVQASVHLGSSVVLNFGSLLTIGVALVALGLIVAFLRRARMGRAIRAAADNEDRARSLGIGPIGVQAVVWSVAGLLGGLAAVLDSMSTGVGGAGGVPVPVLVTILAAAVVASLDSLPLALLAAVVLGGLQQAGTAGTGDQGVPGGGLFWATVGGWPLPPVEVL